jgi:hypothetical protein
LLQQYTSKLSEAEPAGGMGIDGAVTVADYSEAEAMLARELAAAPFERIGQAWRLIIHTIRIQIRSGHQATHAVEVLQTTCASIVLAADGDLSDQCLQAVMVLGLSWPGRD